MKIRFGDCFDFSVLLTSLLRGAGYDAYCVSGYAPQWVTEMDQKHTDIPLELLRSTEEEKKEKPDPDAELLARLGGRYPLKIRIEHRSRYLEARDKEAKDTEEKRLHPPVEKPAVRVIPEVRADRACA